MHTLWNDFSEPDSKMINVSIRFANVLDAEYISRVHIRSWQQTYANFIPESILNNLSVSDRTQQWISLIEQGVMVLVLELNKQIVGFSSVCPFRDEGNHNFSGEISAIYLDPKYWRNGFGTKLCLTALNELSSIGYKEALLWVLSDNIQARAFYEKLGFQATRRFNSEVQQRN